MRRRGQAEKYSVFTPNELLLPRKFIVRASRCIRLQARAILFVGGEAFDIVDAIGRRARPFVRRVITDEIRAATGNSPAPIARIFLESIGLVGVDFVANKAGYHCRWPLSVALRGQPRDRNAPMLRSRSKCEKAPRARERK